MTSIQENWQIIRENIANAAKKSGRTPDDITVIAVTKNVAPASIKELLSLGSFCLGENKVQEMLTKHGLFEPEPEWHIIGHLQTNKVKFVIDKVKMIQSVDSIRLAEEIDKRAKQYGVVMDILIEVNIGNEYSKNGIEYRQIAEFSEHLCSFTNICVKGLMCVAPFVKKPDENRLIYEKMLKSFIDINKEIKHNTGKLYLSMGMSNDYTVAIEEGANMVRIGTALFGART